jgi:hypothetical protein
MQECLDSGNLLPAIEGTPDAIDLSVASNRDDLNFRLLDLTESSLSPEVFYERTRSILSDAGYQLPPITSLAGVFDGESGEEILALGGSPPMHYLYFAYIQDDTITEMLAEVMTEDELEEFLHEDL